LCTGIPGIILKLKAGPAAHCLRLLPIAAKVV